MKSPGANQATTYQMVSQQMIAEQNNANPPSCSNHASVTSPTHNENKASLQPVDHLKHEEPAHPVNLNTDNNLNDHKAFDRADQKPNHSTVDSTDHNASHITDHNMDHTTAPFFKQKNIRFAGCFGSRGCVRNNEPMNCYIPSRRMRKLLKDRSKYKI